MLLLTCAAVTAFAVSLAKAQDDPPPEAGRIASISGNVSIQPAGTDDWGQAYANLSIGPGDRVFTDSDGRAEIQVGQTYVRIGPNSDVSLVDDSAFGITFGVGQGSIHLHSYGLWPRQLLDVSTPNGDAEFGQSGDLRVDVFPADGATIFTNYGQFADVTGAGDFRQELDNGQSLELAGTNPVSPQWLQPAASDDLDYWSQQRDQQIANVASYQYVSPDVAGAADLDAYGDWQGQTEYGAIWFPRNLPGDWAPYHYGHWVNHEPWGWVWVEDESWGYAPFHYGRWVSYGGRWGWVPGPVNMRPVWSPALVVFAGGIHVGGVGVSVWFPLGPGEAYRPWYPCSPRYIDQVNITNIRESSRVHVQTTYVNIVNVTNVTYVNQQRGYTAMRQDDFAAGRPARNVAVRVDVSAMARVQPLARPEPVPTQMSVISRPVAHPVRVTTQRPTLINQKGLQFVAKPGAAPVQAPVRPAPPVRPVLGRTIVAAPAHGVPGRPAGQPAAPNYQQPRGNEPLPQNTAPVNRQDFGPVAQPKRNEQQVAPPVNNPPQQRPEYTPQTRPAPPAPEERQRVAPPPEKPEPQRQEVAPQQTNKKDTEQKPAKSDKDKKKDDKKDDKKKPE
jgi:hypothetical protein